jgi:hypothetical protein
MPIFAHHTQDFVDTRRPHQAFPRYSSGNFSKTRELVGFGRELAARFNSNSMRDKQRLECFLNLEAIYEVLYRGPDHLSDELVLNFRHYINSFLRHYGWLRWDANRRGCKEWHFVYKFHYLKHIGEDSEFVNPNLGSCLSDEDFVGKIASIATGSTKATSTLKLAAKVVAQYFRGLAVHWGAQSM